MSVLSVLDRIATLTNNRTVSEPELTAALHAAGLSRKAIELLKEFEYIAPPNDHPRPYRVAYVRRLLRGVPQLREIAADLKRFRT